MSANRLNGIFPFGIGSGGSTGSEIICQFCGKIHNKGYDIDKDGQEGESVHYIKFMGNTMVECCFDKLENSVFAWREDIVAWLTALSEAACDQATRDSLTAAKGEKTLEALKHIET